MINMIGQTKNKKLIETFKARNSFPRFIVITGPEGYGKSVMAQYIAESIEGYTVYCENSVDSVREVIKNAYNVTKPTVYIFLNAHKMSLQAKNALLKVTEEPPNKANFILTSISMEQLLSTLKSRSTEIKMEPYSVSELKEYRDVPSIKFANCPGDIDKLEEVGVENIVKFCEDTLDDCWNESCYKAMAATCKIKFGEKDTEGYDINLVLTVMQSIMYYRIMVYTANSKYFFQILKIITDTMHLINTYNVSKKAQFDMMLIRIYNLKLSLNKEDK